MKFLPLLIAASLLPLSGFAQQEKVPPVSIRAVLHHPTLQTAELYLADPAGGRVRLELVPEGFSKTQLTQPLNGSILLFDSSEINKDNPTANLAARIRIPSSIKTAMLIILPAAKNSTTPYNAVVIDDSLASFGKGQSRAINLVNVETAIQAGEHRLPISTGKVAEIPVVGDLDQFNMAQTNFYYKTGETWTPFTERQLQYLEQFRRIFIIHRTPGAKKPSVRTIVDTTRNTPSVGAATR